MQSMSSVEISIVVPVGSRRDDLTELYREYRQAISSMGRRYEFIFVLDGPRSDAATALANLRRQGEPITVVGLARFFGEATALMAGFERAQGDTIVTLPAYHQIEAAEIRTLVDALANCDLAIGHRWPRRGGAFERLRRGLYHRLVRWVTRKEFRDLGCGARAMKRRVIAELDLYGDLHRFIPVLADRQGFRVKEVDIRQSPQDRFRGSYQPHEYTRRLLDIFTILFLVRFTKRPLRFFGMIGITTFGLGALMIVVQVVQRVFFSVALADRPALILASLLAVLGLQLLAIGLLGELFIFTHARNVKDYQVDEVIQFAESPPVSPADEAGTGPAVAAHPLTG